MHLLFCKLICHMQHEIKEGKNRKKETKNNFISFSFLRPGEKTQFKIYKLEKSFRSFFQTLFCVSILTRISLNHMVRDAVNIKYNLNIKLPDN